ncbi:MAG TPA: DNA double-strand break repair nuclease NurA [Salinibacter sp.]|nr:DNA double-strand break repair nuclease NurA [Salinibacter sp.]
MLDLSRLRDQLDSFEEYEAEVRDRRTEQQRRARAALRACGEQWTDVQAAVEAAEPRRLVAALREAPTTTTPAPERPTPITVVATDGSQIYPDRHVDPMFFLLNVSQVGFQYGTREEPLVDAEPRLRFQDDLSAHVDEALGSMTTELVSALRDEMELERLLDAARTAQVDERPLVALADGTLIRWMIRGMNNEAVEEQLIARYTEYLQAFQRDGLPLASYVSMPATTEVVNLLRFVVGELEALPPENVAVTPDAPPLDGLLDRHVFDVVLNPGERSATFGSTSHIQRSYPKGSEVHYFYLKVPSRAGPGEMSRVEVPKWVAEDERLLDCIHATVLRECEKGEGYPLALSEAHERAVIRASEREAFFRLMERRLRRAGLSPTDSRKRRSKQAPRV